MKIWFLSKRGEKINKLCAFQKREITPIVTRLWHEFLRFISKQKSEQKKLKWISTNYTTRNFVANKKIWSSIRNKSFLFCFEFLAKKQPKQKVNLFKWKKLKKTKIK